MVTLTRVNSPYTEKKVLNENFDAIEAALNAVPEDTGISEEEVQTLIDASTLTQMSVTKDSLGFKLVNDSDAPGVAKVYGTDGSGVKGWYNGGGGSESTTVSDTSSINLTLTGFDITAAAIFGTSAGTIAQGNDSRFHSAVTVTDTASINLTLTGQDVQAAAIFGTSAGTVAEGNHTHAQLHDAATVLDTDTIDFTMTGQQIQAAARLQMSLTSDASGIKLSGDSASPGNDVFYGTNGSGTKGWYSPPGGSGLSHPQTLARTLGA